MAKERKRDKLLRVVQFRRSTSQPPDSRRAPPPISSSVASSTSVLTGIGLGSPTQIHTLHPPSSPQVPTPTSPSAQPVDTNPDAPIGSDSLLRSEPITATTTPICIVQSEAGNEEQPACTWSKTDQQSLWIQAFNQLSSADRETLEQFVPNSNATSALEGIRTQMGQAMASKRDRAWKIKWRGEDIVLRDISMKIVHCVDKFKQIGDIAVGHDPGHAALPWAAFRLVLQVCLDQGNAADAILIGLEKSSNLIDRCAIYESVYLKEDIVASTALEKTILQLYTAILKFLADALELSKRNVVGLYTVERISALLGDIERCENTLDRDANATGARHMSKSLRTFLDELRTSSGQVGEKLANIDHILEVSKRSQILEWISIIPYTSHHKRISEERLEGTGEWLLARKEYQDWRASSASKMLLLRGIPGAGKTYMASKVIDTLDEEFAKNSTAEKMAYFYCNRAEENRRHPESILNTLIQQLAQSDEDSILKPVVDIYLERERKGQKSSKLTLQESQELLIKITDIHPRTIICLDALDEVEPRIRIVLLQSLKLLIEKSKNLVKIFATSRNDPDILQQFSMFPRIDVQPEDNSSDIDDFIKSKLKHAVDDSQMLHGDVSNTLQDEIFDVLRTRSKGMFQLAAVQITFLCQLDTEGDIRTNLNALPDTLMKVYDELYTQIINQSGRSPQLALNAFRWVKYSYEPLSSNTLLDAVTAQVSDSGDYSQDETITAKTILKVCQNLLIWDEPLDTFRFAHLSVEEYLETKFIEADCHTYITRFCLSLLCSPNDSEKYDKKIRAEEGQYRNRHILLYSVVFWPWHFSRHEALHMVDCDSLMGLWKRFMSQINYRRWFDHYHSTIKTMSWTDELFWQKHHAFAKRKSEEPLSSTCIFGLHRRFKALFELWPDVKDIDTTTLLSYVSRFGYLELVKYLLVNGADISAADEYGSTPLHLASRYGHEAVAWLLLDKGANVSTAQKDGSTPLHLALRYGHDAVARLLLDKGANISAADKYGRTPLDVASRYGHEAVARLLLDNGANVSAANEYGSTPLHLASEYGHEAVARLLLDNGANVSTIDEDGSTPLHLASRYGHEAVARLLLLDKSANVSAADEDGRTPLDVASRYGHEAVARLLLDKGANVSAAQKDGLTPLHLALRNGHEVVAQLLLDNGANISAADKYGRTPLDVASRYRHEAVPRLLLNTGANVSAADEDGSTPLDIASRYGHEAVPRLLLDTGANVSAADEDGSTPLDSASDNSTDTWWWHDRFGSSNPTHPPSRHTVLIKNDLTS